ncbi:MAG: metallophosphoesterase [Gammaproteobacteria bacterium]
MNTPVTVPEKIAAEIIGSGTRVFALSIPDEMINLLVFGCQGEDSPAQQQIAGEMLKFSAPNNIHFALTTGDNIYPHGARSATDEVFETYFYKYYSQLPFPIMMTLGNHDGNYSRIAPYKFNSKLLYSFSTFYSEARNHGFQSPPTGDLTEQNEVDHTFLGDANAKLQLFTQSHITLAELNEAKLKWVMPAQYYSYYIGKMQFIHLNSNTYVKDYLEYTKDRNINNQVNWLEKTYYEALAAGRKIILVQHHSLFTCGKRVFHGDQDHYLNAAQIKEIEGLLGKPGINYNEMLLNIFQRQHFKPSLILGAHDHSLYYYNNAADETQDHKIAQVVSGGGGGKLQDRMSFAEAPLVPMFLKQNGFCHISFNQHNPEEILIHFRTMGNHHVTFSNLHAEPVRAASRDPHVEMLRTAALTACQTYLAFIDQRQKEAHGKFFVTSFMSLSPANNLTHTMNDINILHELMAFLNQHGGLPTFSTTLQEVEAFSLRFSNQDSTNSFKHILDESLFTEFQVELVLLENYFDQPSSSRSSPQLM